MKLLVFGNLLAQKDNLALKLLPRLRKEIPNIEFKEFDPTENLEAEIQDGKLFILDVVEGINKIMIIKDIGQLKTDKIYSMHDFDLGFNLKLLKKIGKLKEIEIIGLPINMNEKEAVKEIKKILNQTFFA
jgi:Ni,Fe-hydrogenase maturation factor